MKNNFLLSQVVTTSDIHTGLAAVFMQVPTLQQMPMLTALRFLYQCDKYVIQGALWNKLIFHKFGI